MNSQRRTRLAQVFPPSVLIKEELAARGWDIKDLAFFSELSIEDLEGVVKDNRRMTRGIARGLGGAFGTSAEFWQNFDAIYRSGSSSQKTPVKAPLAVRPPTAARVVKPKKAYGWNGKDMKAGTRNRQPAQAFPPADFIAEEIEYRGWAPQHLARKAGLPVRTIERILQVEKTVTRADAEGLSKAFGTSVEIWLNMQKSYTAWMRAKAVRPVLAAASRAKTVRTTKRTSKSTVGAKK